MNYLFVHQNFPGQYSHLLRRLAAVPGNKLIFMTQRQGVSLPGVTTIVYRPSRQAHPGTHRYLRNTEAALLNAQAVAREALRLKRSGFVPDIMLGHNGWGEIWYLKDIFPDTPLVGYFEFFYQAQGADVGFDPEFPTTTDTAPRVRTQNTGNLLGLEAADYGQCPTHWQHSTYPAHYRSKLKVLHEGIDTDVVKPDPLAALTVPGSNIQLRAGDEVVTYVARNLEPYRGFPSFMRSLPAVLEKRPEAQILIVGGDDVSYGARPHGEKSYRQMLLEELGATLDASRVHFLGKVPYSTFLRVLQVSRVHVYLTYPFVLSWSMLEAMVAGCLVVGSRTAPVQEAIRDGENGCLVDFFDPEDIAERVVDVLSDPESFAAMGLRARQAIVGRYDLRRICLPAMLKWLDETVARTGTRLESRALG